MMHRPSRNLLLFAVLFEGSLGVLASVVGWMLANSPWQYVRWHIGSAAWGAAATLPLLAGLGLMTHYPVGPLYRLTRIVDEFVSEVFAGASLVVLALVSLLAGFGEELLFRGLVQTWVSDRSGPLVGILLASLLFGLAHCITKTYALLAGLIGLYIGWLFIHFQNNLLVPIVTHALYDFLAIIYLVHRQGRSREKADPLVNECEALRG